MENEKTFIRLEPEVMARLSQHVANLNASEGLGKVTLKEAASYAISRWLDEEEKREREEK